MPLRPWVPTWKQELIDLRRKLDAVRVQKPGDPAPVEPAPEEPPPVIVPEPVPPLPHPSDHAAQNAQGPKPGKGK